MVEGDKGVMGMDVASYGNYHQQDAPMSTQGAFLPVFTALTLPEDLTKRATALEQVRYRYMD